jgi:hypothetical protein
MPHNCYQLIVMKCHSNRPIFVSTSKIAEILYSDVDFTVPQCVIKSSCLLQWFRLCSGSVCHQIIYTSQWVHMHLHHVLFQPPVVMSLYKDTSTCNASSHFTHAISLNSRTILLNMPRYLIPAWNEHPFCRCDQRAKLATSVVLTTYRWRCWVCSDTTTNGDVSFSISIS